VLHSAIHQTRQSVLKTSGLAILFFSIFLFFCTEISAQPLQLPKVYEDQVEVTGWLMSEKLDGVRGYWDGTTLLSKNGNRLHPPEEFLENCPPFPIEGEIWGGRETFQETVSTVAKKKPHDGWLKLRLGIFDVPEAPGSFEERIVLAEEWFEKHPSEYAFVIVQSSVLSRSHMLEELYRIEALGGEGLIVRNPAAHYTDGRSLEVLKVKSFSDEEAKVLSHLPGSGRNRGRLGALLVELENGTIFKIGSGFSDSERENPPPPGSIVSFKHYGEYDSGIPRFPSFLRIRTDMDI
jgi:DNA ligase-1